MTPEIVWFVMTGRSWTDLEVEKHPDTAAWLPLDVGIKGEWFPGSSGFLVFYPTRELAEANANGAKVMPAVMTVERRKEIVEAER